MSNRLRGELVEKYPGLAGRAAASRAAAVKLFCIECMGGSNRDAKECAERSCFLWPHAYRRGAVP